MPADFRFLSPHADLLDLVTDLYVHEFPTQLDLEFDTGSLMSDLFAIQKDQQEFFTTPMVYRGSQVSSEVGHRRR